MTPVAQPPVFKQEGVQVRKVELLGVVHCAGTRDVPSSRRPWGARCAVQFFQYALWTNECLTM